jgi:hypothetical protein
MSCAKAIALRTRVYSMRTRVYSMRARVYSLRRESIPCGHESMHYSKCANTHTSRADNNASGTFVISIS